MAIDAMDLDPPPASSPASSPTKERKRKHKDSSSPTKKKRKHESSQPQPSVTNSPESPYKLTTATLYLPLSPISISPTHALASLQAEHLSPLLLTYYPPLKGIILAYSNTSISSTPPSATPATSVADTPEPLTLARSAGEYGVLYVYLTTTFLVFRPQRGQVLEGWVNVQSEGFLGAISMNLFSVGIERKRLPPNWKWIPPGEEREEQADGDQEQEPASTTDSDSEEKSENGKNTKPFDAEKELFNPVALATDTDLDQVEEAEEATAEGYFQSVSGHRVRGTIRFRVVDVDIIPGSERDRGFMSIEGTMLEPEEERRVLEDERNGVFYSSLSRAGTPRGESMTPVPVPTSSTVTASGALTPAVVEVEVEAEAKSSKKKSTKEKKAKKTKKTKTKE
ncbi:hypothetical protein BO70DRAFT_363653 [Aspergillus heteromorphus CBS 117.55]|uniref:DNA-directed RNA polymerase subunit n=1 Tax=Aspergillus heteromorphus CBS 117.55 TaxID=1448321 RepID=A0A317VW33_9EURO|nr:uncharacterized protein BO70DRAFT_363653 [Aspergillus heteromorphus CBS 117.55]PWY77108.1 hypothetical protein BO70DRAFT_363653 [Aspergillus heteromorphus CBS 117.55]